MSRLRSAWPLLVALAAVALLFLTGVFPSPFRTQPRGGESPGSAAAVEPAAGRINWGAFVDGSDKQAARFGELEKRTAPLTVASVFRGKGDHWPYPVDRALGHNRTLLVSWSLEDFGSYQWWASGKGDKVLRDQASALRSYTGRLAIRPWAEMNADWHDYQPTAAGDKAHGGTPEQFRAAWRHVVTTMRESGVKATWIFNPTTDVYASTTDVRTIYPGRRRRRRGRPGRLQLGHRGRGPAAPLGRLRGDLPAPVPAPASGGGWQAGVDLRGRVSRPDQPRAFGYPGVRWIQGRVA